MDLETELERIAIAERRKRSDIARFLLERGLMAYKRDSQLFEPEPPSSAQDPKARPGDEPGKKGMRTVN